MTAITYDRFDGGLDLRQLASSADANRLRVLKNAYITTGRTIKKRKGTMIVGTLPGNTVGLFSGIDGLFTFTSDTGSPDSVHVHEVGLVRIVKLFYQGDSLSRIVNVEVFNGNLYVAAQFTTGTIRHFYISGNDPKTFLITDANCPHSKSFIKKAGKIFAVDNDVVRFSSTGNATDWTADKDAGFLPVSLQQSVNNKPTALGEYQDNLVVFFEDTAQIWQVDADPANHKLISTIPIGTNHTYAHANMSNDIFFLSPSGFRSIAVQAFSTNMMDNDIGSPIDKLVAEDTKFSHGIKMIYFRAEGQIICFNGTKAYVYCFSRSSKISAWCVWEFDFNILYPVEFDSELYFRTEDSYLCRFKSSKQDDIKGGTFPVEVELPFLDMRSPGVLKQFTGVDVAMSGSCQMWFKFDARNEAYETDELSLYEDTRSLPRIPVEVMATNMSVCMRNESKEDDFELAEVTVYFEKMSGFGV